MWRECKVWEGEWKNTQLDSFRHIFCNLRGQLAENLYILLGSKAAPACWMHLNERRYGNQNNVICYSEMWIYTRLLTSIFYGFYSVDQSIFISFLFYLYFFIKDFFFSSLYLLSRLLENAGLNNWKLTSEAVRYMLHEWKQVCNTLPKWSGDK